jgi:hypothetical protein
MSEALSTAERLAALEEAISPAPVVSVLVDPAWPPEESLAYWRRQRREVAEQLDARPDGRSRAQLVRRLAAADVEIRVYATAEAPELRLDGLLLERAYWARFIGIDLEVVDEPLRVRKAQLVERAGIQLPVIDEQIRLVRLEVDAAMAAA